MSDPLSTLALATGGAFLGKFVGPAAESLGKAAWERAQQLGQKATAMLSAVGREPQPVEPKLLLPLVQAASLETNETLGEMWTALLANAADPAEYVAIQPSFSDVLRQLTPMDAQILANLYAPAGSTATEPMLSGVMVKTLIVSFASNYEQITLSIDNLLRLQLCRSIDTVAKGIGPANIAGTTYGHYFVKACMPPKP